MNLNSAESTRELWHRRVSQMGLIEIGLYKSSIGLRFRARFIQDEPGVYMLDWYCGVRWTEVELLYSFAVHIFGKRAEDEHCFRELPMSVRGSWWFKDPNFVDYIQRAAKSMPPRIHLDENVIYAI